MVGQAAPMPSLGISVGWGNVPDPTPPGLLKDPRQVGGAASGPCEPLTSEESGASLALGGPWTPTLGLHKGFIATDPIPEDPSPRAV